jgi:hypothetical protein
LGGDDAKIERSQRLPIQSDGQFIKSHRKSEKNMAMWRRPCLIASDSWGGFSGGQFAGMMTCNRIQFWHPKPQENGKMERLSGNIETSRLCDAKPIKGIQSALDSL